MVGIDDRDEVRVVEKVWVIAETGWDWKGGKIDLPLSSF
jgi:hypothetical protein